MKSSCRFDWNLFWNPCARVVSAEEQVILYPTIQMLLISSAGPQIEDGDSITNAFDVAAAAVVVVVSYSKSDHNKPRGDYCAC